MSEPNNDQEIKEVSLHRFQYVGNSDRKDAVFDGGVQGTVGVMKYTKVLSTSVNRVKQAHNPHSTLSHCATKVILLTNN